MWCVGRVNGRANVGYGCRTSYRRLWGVVEGDAVDVRVIADSWRVTAE